MVRAASLQPSTPAPRQILPDVSVPRLAPNSLVWRSGNDPGPHSATTRGGSGVTLWGLTNWPGPTAPKPAF